MFSRTRQLSNQLSNQIDLPYGPIYGGFRKWRYPQNGCFIKDNPMKMDDLGVTPL